MYKSSRLPSDTRFRARAHDIKHRPCVCVRVHAVLLGVRISVFSCASCCRTHDALPHPESSKWKCSARRLTSNLAYALTYVTDATDPCEKIHQNLEKWWLRARQDCLKFIQVETCRVKSIPPSPSLSWNKTVPPHHIFVAAVCFSNAIRTKVVNPGLSRVSPWPFHVS